MTAPVWARDEDSGGEVYEEVVGDQEPDFAFNAAAEAVQGHVGSCVGHGVGAVEAGNRVCSSPMPVLSLTSAPPALPRFMRARALHQAILRSPPNLHLPHPQISQHRKYRNTFTFCAVSTTPPRALC